MASPQDSITEWLTLLSKNCRSNGVPEGYHYAGIGDFLTQHGVWYEPKPLPKDIRRGMPRQCFYNALQVSRRRGYRYVEGYAVPDINNLDFPAHHAWNLDHDGKVIDCTWDKLGRAYFGVTFPVDVAKAALAHDGSTVLDNIHSDFELFRTPFCEVISEY